MLRKRRKEKGAGSAWSLKEIGPVMAEAVAGCAITRKARRGRGEGKRGKRGCPPGPTGGKSRNKQNDTGAATGVTRSGGGGGGAIKNRGEK